LIIILHSEMAFLAADQLAEALTLNGGLVDKDVILKF